MWKIKVQHGFGGLRVDLERSYWVEVIGLK